jgi:hypothetical protein
VRTPVKGATRGESAANAAFIVAVNPAVILALLDRLEAGRGAAGKMD